MKNTGNFSFLAHEQKVSFFMEINSKKFKEKDKQSKVVSQGYTYHYDRTFTVFAALVVIISGLYYLVSYELIESSPEPEVVSEQAEKVKHLQVIPEIISQSDKTKKHRTVFLYQESINIFDTFYSTPPPSVEPAPVLAKKPEIEAVKKESVPAKKQKGAFIQVFSSKLSRVQLVSNIYKKEPVNKLSYFVMGPADRAKKVYLFTQLNNITGQLIEHQWWYKGEMKFSKKFTALGKRWRCSSSKNLSRFEQGKWLIKVLDENQKLLSSVNFQYNIY